MFTNAAIGALVAATAILLSGCASPSPNPAQPSPTAPSFGAESGAIQGFVTDQEYAPVRAAQVALQDGAADPVETNAQGEFVFSDLMPGRHIVFITALGYASAARHVDVHAGEIAALQVELELLSPVNPFSVTDIKEGFIACGTGVGQSGLGGFTQVECGSNDPNQQFLFTYPFNKGLKGVLFEMVWKPNQALSKDLAFIVEKEECGFTCGVDDTFAEVQGCCYLRVALPVENLTKPAGELPATDFAGKAGAIQSRTFPAFGENGNPTTVFTSQEFDVYVEYFYNGLPDDWGTRSNLPAVG